MQDKAKVNFMHPESDQLVDRASEPFRRSAEVERLVKSFTALAEGAEISYSVVTAIIGENAQSEHGRSITISARTIARKDFKVVIECEPKKGFKRVPNEIIHELTSGHRQKIRARLKRASQELAAVDPQKLTNGSVSKYYSELSWVGALKQFTNPNLPKRIGEVVTNEALAVGDVLKLCGGK